MSPWSTRSAPTFAACLGSDGLPALHPSRCPSLPTLRASNPAPVPPTPLAMRQCHTMPGDPLSLPTRLYLRHRYRLYRNSNDFDDLLSFWRSETMHGTPTYRFPPVSYHARDLMFPPKPCSLVHYQQSVRERVAVWPRASVIPCQGFQCPPPKPRTLVHYQQTVRERVGLAVCPPLRPTQFDFGI